MLINMQVTVYQCSSIGIQTSPGLGAGSKIFGLNQFYFRCLFPKNLKNYAFFHYCRIRQIHFQSQYRYSCF